jgi:hypothetical protein
MLNFFQGKNYSYQTREGDTNKSKHKRTIYHTDDHSLDKNKTEKFNLKEIKKFGDVFTKRKEMSNKIINRTPIRLSYEDMNNIELYNNTTNVRRTRNKISNLSLTNTTNKSSSKGIPPLKSDKILNKLVTLKSCQNPESKNKRRIYDDNSNTNLPMLKNQNENFTINNLVFPKFSIKHPYKEYIEAPERQQPNINLLINYNRSIINHNDSIKPIFYKPPFEKAVIYDNIIVQTLMSNSKRVSESKSKINSLLKDSSYKRIKLVEAELVNMIKKLSR